MAHCAHVLAPSCAWAASTEPKKRSRSIVSSLGNAIRAMKPGSRRSTQEQVCVLNADALIEIIQECGISKMGVSDDEISTQSEGSRRSSLAESVEPLSPLPGSLEEISMPSSLSVELSSSSSNHPKIPTLDKDYREDWDVQEMFAEGTSSIVHRTCRKGASSSSPSDSTPAVVKVSRPGKEGELVKEAKLLQHIGRHPHIVELMGFYHSKLSGTALVLELLDGGEILQLVEQPCSEMQVRIVAIQVCQALGYIHSRGIVHRDVKAENIVLSGRAGEVKLVDFGLAAFEEDDEAMMTRCGSPGYIAPEVIDGTRCSFVADIFGLGVVVYLLIAGRLPFHGKSPTDVLRRNLRCHVKFEDDIWFGLAECKSFVACLLVKEPEQRPAAVDVWRHPWFACLIADEGGPGGNAGSASGEASTAKAADPAQAAL